MALNAILPSLEAVKLISSYYEQVTEASRIVIY